MSWYACTNLLRICTVSSSDISARCSAIIASCTSPVLSTIDATASLASDADFSTPSRSWLNPDVTPEVPPPAPPASEPEEPAPIREVDDAEVIELALIENLQRKDLTPFEEAEAIHGLADRCGYTHEDLARKLGKSRTSVTESLALMSMPEEVRNLCRLADISSKSLLLQIVRQEQPEKMIALIERIASQGGATRQQVRDAVAKPKAGRPKNYIFAYRPPTKLFNLKISFAKNKVEKDEIISALEAIIQDLRAARQ